MPNYHLEVKSISRKKGRSSAAAAAYQSRSRMYDDYYGLTHDYSRRKDVLYIEVLLPSNAPQEYLDRRTLWNAVENAEKRKDSRTAREIICSLPNELTLQEQIELVKEYVTDNFVNQGMCADIAIHEGKNKNPKKNNPHVHILLTTRYVNRDGFAGKNREWDKREKVTVWRKQWAAAQNKSYERKGLKERVSHESHVSRGLDREPKRYLNRYDIALERQGIHTERGDENRAITAQRHLERRIQQEHIREQEREISR